MASKAGIGGALLLCMMASGAAAQGSTDEPFAVLSRGRPLPHAQRTVVVLHDTLPPADTTRATPAAATAPTRTAATTPAASTVTTRTTPTNSPPAATRRTPATTASASARTAAAPRTHTVSWGDTWYGIALKHDVSSSSLRAANPDVDPERLRSGTVLRIPSGPGTERAPATPSTTATTTRTASAPARRTHRVEAGESLWGISRRYGVSTSAIREANDLEGDRVRIGATLVIPEED